MSGDSPAVSQHRQVLVALSALLGVMLLAALDSTIVATALPTIVRDIGGLEHLAWVITAYLLAQTVATPVYGKLGDLYGRKLVLLSAVGVFLLGSLLCAVSMSMTQLIVCRAIQGLGGGGLNVTTQAMVGDIVSPRKRGRFQRIFGAMFGLASIAGPLAGGYVTAEFSWRWIFYVNLPIGLSALVVLAFTLPAATLRVRHDIDYLGAALLAIVLGSLTMLATVSGTTAVWAPVVSSSLIVIAVAALVAFVFAERSASEPVMPMRLFARRSFSIASAVGLIVGFALFGSVTFFPLYLQSVKGVGPAASGLHLIPMMVAMLATSIASGQVISRTGQYKVFPIVGMFVMTIALWQLSYLGNDTPVFTASALMVMLGVGLGMVTQVLVIAVQNTVPYRDLGVATSGATLFRLVGGSVGTAVLGALFASRFAAAAGDFSTAVDHVFILVAAVSLVGFMLVWFIPQRPLRATLAVAAADTATELSEAFARPVDEQAARDQLSRAFVALADRDVRRSHIARIVARAGETLSPLAAWLLVQIEQHPEKDPVQLGERRHINAERIHGALDELDERELIAMALAYPVRIVLTSRGWSVLEKLVRARRERLEDLAADWDPAHEPDAAEYLRQVVRTSVPDVTLGT